MGLKVESAVPFNPEALEHLLSPTLPTNMKMNLSRG